MIQRLLLAVLALAFCSTFLTASVSPPLGDDEEILAGALADFNRAAAKSNYKARRASLKVVVSLANEDALPDLMKRLGAVAKVVDQALVNTEVEQIMLERRRVQLAEVSLAFERNESLKDKVKELESAVKAREQALDTARADYKKEKPWRDDLRGGIADIVTAQATGKRRGIMKGMWKTFEKGERESERLMAAWVLVDFGESGTAERFAKVLVKVLAERAKVKLGLPPLEAKVREWERRLQQEMRAQGSFQKSTQVAYNQVQSEAKRFSNKLKKMEDFGVGLVASAGQAMALESDPEKAAKSLLKMARKSPQQASLVEVFVKAELIELGLLLGAELAAAKQDRFKQVLIDALAKLGCREVAEPWLLAEGLTNKSWLVRSHSASALALLRSKAAVPVLIERLKIEEGRLLTDVTSALVSLSGKDFHGNQLLWERWWGDHAETFEVTEEAAASTESKALEAVGTTFFGMRFDSQSVLFVLDVSGSMDEEMESYGNAKGKGEKRITVARRELLKALKGIRDGGVFNIELYATEVWTWAEEPVVMDEDSRAAAIDFINNLQVVGGTNLYGAVKSALNQARGDGKRKARGAPKWIAPVYDTIFLLSDGAPSQGLSTDRNDILEMAIEENANLGVTINTIGLSMGQDVVLMRNLAEQTGGTYVAR